MDVFKSNTCSSAYRPIIQDLLEGTITSVFLNLSDCPPPPQTPPTFLSAPEQKRFEQYRSPEAKKRFLAGRWICKSILATVLDQPDIPMEVTEGSKPFCPLPGSPRFSISHSGSWVAVSFARKIEIGIDIERIITRRNLNEISRRYFTETECEAVLTHGPGQFFQIWTEKESWAKVTGKGIFKSLGSKNPRPSHTPSPVTFVRYGISPEYACCLAHAGTRQTYAAWKIPGAGTVVPVPEIQSIHQSAGFTLPSDF